MRRVHLDTDLGGDPDDGCALAMLLGWPGVEVVGITTTADSDGRRAGYVNGDVLSVDGGQWLGKAVYTTAATGAGS